MPCAVDSVDNTPAVNAVFLDINRAIESVTAQIASPGHINVNGTEHFVPNHFKDDCFDSQRRERGFGPGCIEGLVNALTRMQRESFHLSVHPQKFHGLRRTGPGNNGDPYPRV